MKNDGKSIDWSFEVINIIWIRLIRESSAGNKIEVNEPDTNSYLKSDPNTTNKID